VGPDNRRIAFIRYIYEPGYYHHAVLETYQVDNGVTNGILSEPLLESSLAWTHDNRLIYSVREPSPESGDSNLWVISVDPQTGRARGAAERLTASPDRKLLVGSANSGNELAYLRLTYHSQIYVSEVAGKAETNRAETRVKIDEGNNYPYGWMPDGESIIFASDRDGIRHIYKQSVSQLTPDLLIGGNEPIGIPRVSPDRSEIFYYVGPPHGKESAPSRILSIAVNGGSPREVLRAHGIIDFQCARAPANVCIVAQTSLETVHYSTFDPKTGVMVPALTIPGANLSESFSPDGTTLAVGTDRTGRVPSEIELYNLRDATHSTLRVEGWGTDYGMDWNPDGKSLWVHARTPKGVAAIVNIDRQGHVTPLLEDSENQLGWAIPSPDGTWVAYSKPNISSNVWLLRDF
jgi:Tol biopolymer transport system component